MSVPVLTAVTGAVWEADLVAELDRSEHGIAVVRRCVDLADLLAVASSGLARAALLSAELRRLDRDAVTRLAAAGVAVVGLVNPGDEAAGRRLRQLGVPHVLGVDAGAGSIAELVLEAVAELGGGDATAAARRMVSDPRGALPDLGADAPQPADGPEDSGRVVAVWGPTGAPGRSTVAVGLADEAARLGVSTLLVDADVYGGVLAQVLGLLDESPGLAAAARHAGAGTLDPAVLDRIALRVTPELRVLTGIARADRWTEIPGSSMQVVLDVARRSAELTVIDCAFSIEQDEELAYDTVAPRRNGATIAALAGADVVLCVGSADPVALQRLVRALASLHDSLPEITPSVVVNRVRKGVIPGDPMQEIGAALQRYAGIADPAYLPNDPAAMDACLAVGKTLGETAPGSNLRSALIELARETAQLPAVKNSRRRR